MLEGYHKSQKILIALINKGLSRKKSYSIVQKAALKTWNSKIKFEEVIKKDNNVKKFFNHKELKLLLKSQTNIKHINYIFKKVFNK